MVAAQVCQSQQVGRSEDSLIGVPVHSSRVRAVPISSEGPSSILDVSAGAAVSISSAASMVEQGSKVSRDSVSSLVSFAHPIVSSVVSVDELDDRRLIWKERGSVWDVVVSAPNDLCEYYGRCSANGVCSVGKAPICECLQGFIPESQQNQTSPTRCVRSSPFDCGSGDRFIKLTGLKLPDLVETSLNDTMSLQEWFNPKFFQDEHNAHSLMKMVGMVKLRLILVKIPPAGITELSSTPAQLLTGFQWRSGGMTPKLLIEKGMQLF
ncbi:hypothetical protein LWI29_028836 [Acer saccharum]|uniref:EGF-like domain-containing protein n=1 Tax=Acer saccharum TaxID=4024 RepID=A0AA39T727_ACESA|nr:hypothetical protein LWI29_028836 [Acer saccharum]